jgi:hypothetical protein
MSKKRNQPAPHWRESQEMPDPLRGAWWMTLFFTVWFWFDRR